MDGLVEYRVQHDGNRGYGAALRTGFEAARFDLVAFTDADCQFDLSELEYMLPLTRRYHVTTGYRMIALNAKKASCGHSSSWR